MHTRRWFVGWLCCLVGLVLTSAAAWGFPVQVPYSGQLAEQGELVNGNKSMRFKIVDGGAKTLYDSGNLKVGVSNGAFSVILGGAGLPPLDSSVFSSTGLKLRVHTPESKEGLDVPMPGQFSFQISVGDHLCPGIQTGGTPTFQLVIGGEVLYETGLLDARSVARNWEATLGTEATLFDIALLQKSDLSLRVVRDRQVLGPDLPLASVAVPPKRR